MGTVLLHVKDVRYQRQYLGQQQHQQTEMEQVVLQLPAGETPVLVVLILSVNQVPIVRKESVHSTEINVKLKTVTSDVPVIVNVLPVTTVRKAVVS